MEAFWHTWGNAIQQGVLVLGIAASFGVGVAPQIGNRRRVENLKLGAETLAVLTHDEDRRAVERFMARERDILLGKVVLSATSFVMMGVLVLLVVVFAPLLRARATPGIEPTPMWWAYGATLVAVSGSFLVGRIVARRLAERRRARLDAVPQAVAE